MFGIVHQLHLREIHAVVVWLQNLLELKDVSQYSLKKKRAVLMNERDIWYPVTIGLRSGWKRMQPLLFTAKLYPFTPSWGLIQSGRLKKDTLYGGISFSISAIGTSVPATPRSSAMRTWCREERSIKFTWWKIFRRGHGKDQARLYKLQLTPGGKANLLLKGSTPLQGFTAEEDYGRGERLGLIGFPLHKSYEW